MVAERERAHRRSGTGAGKTFQPHGDALRRQASIEQPNRRRCLASFQQRFGRTALREGGADGSGLRQDRPQGECLTAYPLRVHPPAVTILPSLWLDASRLQSATLRGDTPALPAKDPLRSGRRNRVSTLMEKRQVALPRTRLVRPGLTRQHQGKSASLIRTIGERSRRSRPIQGVSACRRTLGLASK